MHQNCLMDGSLHEAISKIHSVENVLVLDSLVSTSETVIVSKKEGGGRLFSTWYKFYLKIAVTYIPT